MSHISTAAFSRLKIPNAFGDGGYLFQQGSEICARGVTRMTHSSTRCELTGWSCDRISQDKCSCSFGTGPRRQDPCCSEHFPCSSCPTRPLLFGGHYKLCHTYVTVSLKRLIYEQCTHTEITHAYTSIQKHSLQASP